MKILNALQLKAYKLYFSNHMNSWKTQLRVEASRELQNETFIQSLRCLVRKSQG